MSPALPFHPTQDIFLAPQETAGKSKSPAEPLPAVFLPNSAPGTSQHETEFASPSRSFSLERFGFYDKLRTFLQIFCDLVISHKMKLSKKRKDRGEQMEKAVPKSRQACIGWIVTLCDGVWAPGATDTTRMLPQHSYTD